MTQKSGISMICKNATVLFFFFFFLQKFIFRINAVLLSFLLLLGMIM